MKVLAPSTLVKAMHGRVFLGQTQENAPDLPGSHSSQNGESEDQKEGAVSQK